MLKKIKKIITGLTILTCLSNSVYANPLEEKVDTIEDGFDYLGEIPKILAESYSSLILTVLIHESGHALAIKAMNKGYASVYVDSLIKGQTYYYSELNRKEKRILSIAGV